jgi:hypothetical protein
MVSSFNEEGRRRATSALFQKLRNMSKKYAQSAMAFFQWFLE